MAPLDKMDPRRAKSAPGAIELNRHFGAETDLLNLQCLGYQKKDIKLILRKKNEEFSF